MISNFIGSPHQSAGTGSFKKDHRHCSLVDHHAHHNDNIDGQNPCFQSEQHERLSVIPCTQEDTFCIIDWDGKRLTIKSGGVGFSYPFKKCSIQSMWGEVSGEVVGGLMFRIQYETIELYYKRVAYLFIFFLSNAAPSFSLLHYSGL